MTAPRPHSEPVSLRVTRRIEYTDVTGLTHEQFADLLSALSESVRWCDYIGYSYGAEKSRQLLDVLRSTPVSGSGANNGQLVAISSFPNRQGHGMQPVLAEGAVGCDQDRQG